MIPSFLDRLRSLIATAALAVSDPRPRGKFRRLALALLYAPKPKTITSALEWLDQTQEDWSADYRLFSQSDWDVQAAYLARWEVEVNFRDEKTLLGVGQAQVLHPQSVARAPAFLVACYAMLQWSSIQVFGDQRTKDFAALPAWRKDEPARPSTRDLIRLLQRQAAESERNPMRS
jgi:hypothetical protein